MQNPSSIWKFKMWFIQEKNLLILKPYIIIHKDCFIPRSILKKNLKFGHQKNNSPLKP
jgi:hypothetical protein